MKRLHLFLLLLPGFNAGLHAQVDPHFSQFYAHPLWLNPALTGAFEGQVRAAAIYRGQWANVSPYRSIGVSADLRTNRNLNIGLSFLQQSAGDGGYKYQNGGLSVSYSGVRLGPEGTQQVFIGMQLGYVGRGFNPDGLRYGSQWQAGLGFDPNTSPGDAPTLQSSGSFDASAGIAWMNTNAEAAVQPYAGVSVSHLMRPEDPFYAGTKFHLPLRYAVHGGFRYLLSDATRLQVQLLYLRQGTSEERMAGAGINFMVADNTELLAGASYRLGDAVSPYAGLRFGSVTLGASYDHTISGLSKMAGNTNAFELSLSWILSKEEGYDIPCPRF